MRRYLRAGCEVDRVGRRKHESGTCALRQGVRNLRNRVRKALDGPLQALRRRLQELRRCLPRSGPLSPRIHGCRDSRQARGPVSWAPDGARSLPAAPPTPCCRPSARRGRADRRGSGPRQFRRRSRRPAFNRPTSSACRHCPNKYIDRSGSHGVASRTAARAEYRHRQRRAAMGAGGDSSIHAPIN